jgi:glycosyltransferase involved in cell wall biosynthesis
MPRILIVTAGPLCRNPRVLKEATTLGRSGLDVTVLTVANHERFEAYDRELMRGAPFRKLAVDRVSRDPVTRLVDVAERAAARAARGAIRFGLQSPVSLGSYHALRRLALRTPAELTILHTEIPFSFGSCLVSRGRRVAADFEDWHSRDLLPASRASRPLRLIEGSERFLMQRSAYTSAPSGSMAAALASAYGGRLPVVIPNSFPLQPGPRPLPRQSPPSFFWFSQTIGEGRGLEEFLAAWSLCRVPSSVSLLGDISSSYRDKLICLVPGERRSSLRFLPLTSPENLPTLIAEHDIGLALEPALPESRYLTATNKIFQYLNAGLAVLATPTAGQREVLARAPEAGLLVDLGIPCALASTLDAVAGDPVRLAAMGSASRQGAVEQFSWEHFEPLLVDTVNAALKP